MNRLRNAVIGTAAGAAIGVGASLGASMLERPNPSTVEACADLLGDEPQEVMVLPAECNALNSETNIVFAAEVDANGASVYTLPSKKDFLTEQRDGAAATTKGYAIGFMVLGALVSIFTIENIPKRVVNRIKDLKGNRQGGPPITSKNNFLARIHQANYDALVAQGITPSAPSGPIVTNRAYRKILDSKPVLDLAEAIRNDERTRYAAGRFMTSRLVKKFLEITEPTDE